VLPSSPWPTVLQTASSGLTRSRRTVLYSSWIKCPNQANSSGLVTTFYVSACACAMNQHVCELLICSSCGSHSHAPESCSEAGASFARCMQEGTACRIF